MREKNMNKVLMLVLLCLVAGVLSGCKKEQAEPAQGGQASPTTRSSDETGTDGSMAKALTIIGACLGAGLCAVGGGFGIARIGATCIESIARQPEAAGSVFAPMIVTAAMVEGGMLFAIVVCLFAVFKAG